MVAEQAGTPELAASGLKAALDRDWDDPARPGGGPRLATSAQRADRRIA